MKILRIKSIMWGCLLILLISSCASSHKRYRTSAYTQSDSPQQMYIRKHYSEALKQMRRHGIPASITLAQGVLETGSGRSNLARQHNNHFGIKCAGTWGGKKIYATDDSYNECFRSYKTWQESYEDHSLFLKKRRYYKLFNLRETDYKSWAKGLQKCGYATNPRYAKRLIDLIEKYELDKFDRGSKPMWLLEECELSLAEPMNQSSVPAPRLHHQIYTSSGLHYTLAQEGDDYISIAEDFDLIAQNLAEFNELELRTKLKNGEIVYLEPKREEAALPYLWHVVQRGESMYSIAQNYGMKLSALYTLNDKTADFLPTEGESFV